MNTPPSSAPRFNHVMCIDDGDLDRFLVKALLTKERFAASVSCYPSAGEALAWLHRNAGSIACLPELIFLDINMPGMNGFGFLASFAELAESVRDHCRIVMLSSSVNSDEIEKAQSDPHMMLYIDKPLTGEKLEMIAGRLKACRSKK